MQQTASSAEWKPLDFDTDQRFVLVRNERRDGFIEFDFSVGEPEVFVEMILPRSAFDEFCRDNHVRLITEDDVNLDASAEGVWRLSETTGKHDK